MRAECVLAMHDFVHRQKNATCLAFRAGQIIYALNCDASGWWDGELDGKRGWFPSNYVSGDLSLLPDDAMAPIPHARSAHSHSKSTVLMASFASSTSSRQSTVDGAFAARTLSAAERSPFESSNTLSAFGRLHHLLCLFCAGRSGLSRDAPLLKRYSSIAREQCWVLSDLAAIITQAKKASAEGVDEDKRDLEVEKMVRLGGQVFSRLRRSAFGGKM
ncbi:hypothetical protein EW146_g7983 [Bondarzewia mesenterica]|uniref:SH3 domain-containing protein n=1 Tax=Bondarzewia mesenterica TaxID=1095465 RepID=A0A4S4LJT4_9AGAM|nr:hypothetical protein EW146_g7983 [Bondarzewia mesenterica]